jgi:hypothetical protein
LEKLKEEMPGLEIDNCGVTDAYKQHEKKCAAAEAFYERYKKPREGPTSFLN